MAAGRQTLRWQRFRPPRDLPRTSKRYAGSVFEGSATLESGQTLRWQRFRRCGGPRKGPNATLAAFSTLRRRPKQPKRYAGSVFDVAEPPEEAQTLRWQRFPRFRVVGEAPRKSPKRVPAHPRPKKVNFQINFKRRIDFFGSPDFFIFWGAWPRSRNVA